ncbi:GNAT family protein [Rhodanobacter sp. MP1X3]|uniref:GNAT family N-acetyltransferase n=1 Tax=Rhodanobacter sp. MP1X3 TaxID=2723086 RepID=UPI0016211FCB|nr:GNAT family protein [Rhodanobacter sp. MP1X3]MBB6243804.1 RimJ/RimL family protein N-acetyltransferase [Rhodanobacter sp. MP1X3]
MQLTTTRLRLDGLRREDAEVLFRYRADPEVSRYQGWRPAFVDDARRFIEACHAVAPDTPGTWFQRAIRWSRTDELIGDVGLHFVADAEAAVELGISLSPSYQKRGIATEALNAVLGFVFDSLHKHRVFGSVDPRNHASIKLLEGVGMRKEAHFRESLRMDGEWADDVIYAMLDREWQACCTAKPHRG